MPYLTPVQRAEVVTRYLEEEGTPTLAKVYGISQASVYSLLKRRGVETRSKMQGITLYKANRSYFTEIDSEDRAYWLGFIAADGNISDRGELRITLKAGDKDHLQHFLDDIESEHPIGLGMVGKYPVARAAIVSLELAADLLKLGITPRKTDTLRWLTLRSDLQHHFVRGYVDGDGCWYPKGVKSSFSVMANYEFCTALQDYLVQNVGLSKTKLYRQKPDSSAYVLFYGGRQQVVKIREFLYQGAKTYLPRKFTKARQI